MPFGPKRWQRLLRGVTVCVAVTAVLAGTVSPTVFVHANLEGDRSHCHSHGHIHWHDRAAQQHDRAPAPEHTCSVTERVRHSHECPTSAGALGLADPNVITHAVFAGNTQHAHVYWWGFAITLPFESPQDPGKPHGDNQDLCLTCLLRELDGCRAVPATPPARISVLTPALPSAIASPGETSLLAVPLLPSPPLCDRARQERSGVLRA